MFNKQYKKTLTCAIVVENHVEYSRVSVEEELPCVWIEIRIMSPFIIWQSREEDIAYLRRDEKPLKDTQRTRLSTSNKQFKKTYLCDNS